MFRSSSSSVCKGLHICRAISSKVHKMMQYACAVDHVVLHGAMKVNMREVAFQLVAPDFGSNSL